MKCQKCQNIPKAFFQSRKIHFFQKKSETYFTTQLLLFCVKFIASPFSAVRRNTSMRKKKWHVFLIDIFQEHRKNRLVNVLRESEEDCHSTLKALEQIYDLGVGTKSCLNLTDWKFDQLRTNYVQIFNVCLFPFFTV